jgi:cobalt/nickel transport system permease protein
MSASSGRAITGVAGDTASPIHRLDPRAKLLGLVGVTVVAVSAPLRAWPVWVACALALLVVAVLAHVPAREVWRRTRVVLPLVVFVAAFVPFVRPGGTTWSLGPLTVSEAGLAVLASVTAKATIGTVSAVLLGATTPFPAVLRALEALRVPRLLVLIAAFTYRYLFVVLAEVGRLRAGLVSRGYAPRHALQAAAVGRAASVLFLRTHARAERVHMAMLARGFGGSMPRAEALSLGRADIAFVGLLAVALLPARVVAEAVA